MSLFHTIFHQQLTRVLLKVVALHIEKQQQRNSEVSMNNHLEINNLINNYFRVLNRTPKIVLTIGGRVF